MGAPCTAAEGELHMHCSDEHVRRGTMMVVIGTFRLQMGIVSKPSQDDAHPTHATMPHSLSTIDIYAALLRSQRWKGLQSSRRT